MRFTISATFSVTPEKIFIPSKRSCVWFWVSVWLTKEPSSSVINETGIMLTTTNSSTFIIKLKYDITQFSPGERRLVIVYSYVPSCLKVPRETSKSGPRDSVSSKIKSSARSERQMNSISLFSRYDL